MSKKSTTLDQMVNEFLVANQEIKFTARQIADWIFSNHHSWCKHKQSRSKATVNPLDTDLAIMQQIVAEIGAHRPRLQSNNPNIKTTEGRPRKYYFTSKTDEIEIDQLEKTLPVSEGKVSDAPKDSLTEQALYSKLSQFMYIEHHVYTKRINEKRSKNNQGPHGNRWLYPDLTGMEDLSRDWNRDLKDLVKEYFDKKTRLWSFEVKMLINRSNVRETFFQAVSNSSWANFGYLVAAEIQGEDTLKELRILSGLHGIGFIKLDSDNPVESQILIPAKERTDIAWHTANRLIDENTDFKEYVELVRQFYQTGNPRAKDWDYKD